MTTIVLNAATGTVSTLSTNNIDQSSGGTLTIGGNTGTTSINLGSASTLQRVNIGSSGTGQTLINVGGSTDSVARFSVTVVQMGGVATNATAADWLSGTIYVNSSGVATLTVPTAASMETYLGLSNLSAGMVWQTLLVHNGSVINCAANTGVTFGSSGVGTTASGVVRIAYTRFVSTGVWVIY